MAVQSETGRRHAFRIKNATIEDEVKETDPRSEFGFTPFEKQPPGKKSNYPSWGAPAPQTPGPGTSGANGGPKILVVLRRLF